MELLDQAAAVYRSALEVFTREQQPQQWAEVQDSLGRALTERARRTKGEGGTELVVQAVTILKSALEVTTRELFAERMGTESKRPGRCVHRTGYSERGRQGRRVPWPSGGRLP